MSDRDSVPVGAPSGVIAAACRLFRIYQNAMCVFAGASMAVLVVVTTVQVAARYVFNDSLIWAEELCRYVLIWQTFLLVGLAFQRGEMIAVDIVPLMLRPRWRFVLKLVATTPVLVFLYLMTVNGYDYSTRFGGQNLPAIDFIWMALAGEQANVSVFWVYVSVAVGSALLALHLIGDLAIDFLTLLDLVPAPAAPVSHTAV